MEQQNQQNQMNSSSQILNEPVATNSNPAPKSSIGSIIGTVVIIALIILGGLYFWGKRIEESKIKQDLVTDTSQSQNLSESDESIQYEASVIKSVSSQDDINSIEADLNGTNLNNLSSELNIEAE